MNNDKSNGDSPVDKPTVEGNPPSDEAGTITGGEVESAPAKQDDRKAGVGASEKPAATSENTTKTSDAAKKDLSKADLIKSGTSKADSKSRVKNAAKGPAKGKEKSSGGHPIIKSLIVLLVLLVVAGLGVAGWWFYQNQPKPAPAPAIDHIADQQAQIDRLESELKREQQERQRQQAELGAITSELQLTMNSHARRLRELSTTSRQDWLLAEAEYLIRLANQRLITERNTKNATMLMITADEILRDLDEVDLYPVRRALAKSITALKMAPRVDREGLYLKLNALSEQAVLLPLMTPELLEGDTVNVVPETVEEEGWRGQFWQGFNKAVSGFNELVRVRRRNEPLQPLLSPEDEQFIRHNLGIKLEQAKLALLREEPVIYQASLVQAQQWLENYFELNEGAKQLAEQLSLLSEENVVQELPDISGGLESLRDFIDSWHKRHVVDKADSDNGEQQ